MRFGIYKKELLLLVLLCSPFVSARAEMLDDDYMVCGDWTFDSMDPGILLSRFQTPMMPEIKWSFTYRTKRKILTNSRVGDEQSCMILSISTQNGVTTFQGDGCRITLKDDVAQIDGLPPTPNCKLGATIPEIEAAFLVKQLPPEEDPNY